MISCPYSTQKRDPEQKRIGTTRLVDLQRGNAEAIQIPSLTTSNVQMPLYFLRWRLLERLSLLDELVNAGK